MPLRPLKLPYDFLVTCSTQSAIAQVPTEAGKYPAGCLGGAIARQIVVQASPRKPGSTDAPNGHTSTEKGQHDSGLGASGRHFSYVRRDSAGTYYGYRSRKVTVPLGSHHR